MQSQVEMDAIKVAAELWLKDFNSRFKGTWMKGLESLQQAQTQAQPTALPEEVSTQQQPEAEAQALIQQLTQQQEVSNGTSAR